MYRTDKQFMRNPATAASRIYVGNLAENVSPPALEEKFTVHGRILGLVVQRGFGFIQFESEDQAQSAINNEHGSLFFGKKLNVKQAVDNARAKFNNPNMQQRNFPQQNMPPNQMQNMNNQGPGQNFQGNQQNQQSGGNFQGNQQNQHPPSGQNYQGNQGPQKQPNFKGNQGQQQQPQNFQGNQQNQQSNQNYQQNQQSKTNFQVNQPNTHGAPNNFQGNQQNQRFPPAPSNHTNQKDLFGGNMPANKPSITNEELQNANVPAAPCLQQQPPMNPPNISDHSPGPNKPPQMPPRPPSEFSNMSDNSTEKTDRKRRRRRPNREFNNKEDAPNQPEFRENFGGGMDDSVSSNPNQFNNFYDQPTGRSFGPDGGYHSSHVDIPERNDCEIIVVSKALTKYAEYIEQRLKDLGLIVDLLFPNDDVPIGRVLGNISSRGCLYAILVMPQNEECRSLTLNVLHGIPEEHRNMPIEDAFLLITRNFDAYMRGETTNSSTMTLTSRHPEHIQMILNLLAENRQIGTSSYDKVIKYLQEKKDLQSSFEIAEGLDTGIEPEVKSKQAELQNRILSILNKKEEQEVIQEKMDTSTKPVVQDPSVQKALDSLFSGEIFKGLTS